MPIGEDGPIIDVRIWIGTERKGALDALGLPVPPPSSIRGLVDTGARMTAIQRAWVQAMGLPVHDWISLKSSVLGDEESPRKTRLVSGHPRCCTRTSRRRLWTATQSN
jgi:hypothetical protein